MSTKDVFWDDLSPPTNISCNNQNIGCDLPKWGTDHQISWTNRDLINQSDKCPRTILKELGSLNILRISSDRTQLRSCHGDQVEVAWYHLGGHELSAVHLSQGSLCMNN